MSAPAEMTKDELLAELEQQRQRTLEVYERLRLAREQRDRNAERADAALVELRRVARREGMPSLMVKVRAFEPDAEETGRLPQVRYFGPSHAHNARNVARELRRRGKRVEVLTATLGRWQEVDW